MQLWPNIQEDMYVAAIPNVSAHLVSLLYVGKLYTLVRTALMKSFLVLRSDSNQGNVRNLRLPQKYAVYIPRE